MSAVTFAARLVVDAALGTWFGAMAFFSFVGAPRAFAVLDESAGRYVNSVFPVYYVVGVALGVAGVLASLVLGFAGEFSAPLWATVAAAALATVAHGYARWVLVPRMDEAGEDAFERYHGQSVALNGAAMLAVAAAFVAVHL